MTTPATVLCPTCGASTAPPTCAACQGPAWLDGRWALVRPQARGVSTTRWDGWDAAGARSVEIVSLNAPWLTPEARVRLLIESPLWAGIEAPLATCVHGHGAAAVVHVVFAARTRPTLAERLAAQGGAMRPEEADALLDSVADALAALHAATPPRAWGGVAPAQLVHGERWEIRAPIHALGVLADAGIPVALEADALPWQAPERLAGAPAHPTADVYALSALALAARTDGAAGSSADREARLWTSGWPPALQAVLRETLAAEPAWRPRDAGALLSRLSEARSAPAESAHGRALAFLDGQDRSRDLADALAAPMPKPRGASGRTLSLAAGLIVLAGLGWTLASGPATSPSPEAVTPAGTPEAAETWESRVAALPPDAPDSRVAELRGEVKAAADAAGSEAERARARAAEAVLALRVGDDAGAWSAWREACATDGRTCAPLGHAILDGRIGAATLGEGVAALARACDAGDAVACTRQGRVETYLTGPARQEVHDSLARACAEASGTSDSACWRVARLDLAEEAAAATARLGTLCTAGAGPACGWQAEGLRREGDTAEARALATAACGDADPHACVVLARLSSESTRARDDDPAQGGSPSAKAKKVRKGKKSRGRDAGSTPKARDTHARSDTARGAALSASLLVSLTKACDAG